jgi:uncharacterized circularly permuted ATP-grasp superfamily protein
MSALNPAQFDEMYAPDGSVRDAYSDYQAWLSEQDAAWMRRKGAEAESFFRRTGITFNVYGDDDGEERLIPFDMVPRIITGSEWRRLSRGIEQRVSALNAFMRDLYHRQEIVRSGRLPERLFRDNKAWLPEMVGFTRRAGSTRISSASTSCAPARTSSSCSRTTRARPRASATCSRTARR